MEAIELNTEEMDDIRMFFKKNELSHNFQNTFDGLLDDLPHTCRQKIVNALYNSVLLANPVISQSMQNMFNVTTDLMIQLHRAHRWKYATSKMHQNLLK